MAMFRGQKTGRADACFDRWVAWRAACDTVEAAYRQWASARAAERALAFAQYRAALAFEEEQAEDYAALAGRRPRLRAVGI